ncbi:plastocyanin/azurin family copper-binding protein [Paraconexibacter sp.]|uniref:plastocyanin/azurin family copper-binding protein n=1 Tax=Paraconexibacter sp. TaxID=2949640 RepID=UPI0035692D33
MNSRVSFPRALRPAMIVGVALAATAFSGCSVNNDGDDQIAGKQLFVAKCGSCHILGRADTKGVTGPNLDEAFRQSIKDGFGRDAIRGVVYRQILDPREGSAMPADLVDDEGARDIAAYVADVAARGGEDEGLLGSAVEKAGSDEPAVAENGVLTIPADPGGQLIFVNSKAEAPAGTLEINMPNESGVPHNIVIDGKGESPVVTEGDSKFTADFEPGEYTYYCAVPGHQEAGMVGTLTVK